MYSACMNVDSLFIFRPKTDRRVVCRKAHYQDANFTCLSNDWFFLKITQLYVTFQNLEEECIVAHLFWKNRSVMDNSFDIESHITMVWTFPLIFVLETLNFSICRIGMFQDCIGKLKSHHW
jgi:hypothetical protein